MAKVSSDSVNSFAVGLNKGFKVTKVQRKAKRGYRSSDRVRTIRKIVRSVVDLTPLEKRTIEMFKTGVQ